MRQTFFLLPLLAGAAPSIGKRQAGMFLPAPGAVEKPVRTTKGEASLYEGAVRETLLFGPFNVSAADAKHASVNPIMLKLDPTSDLLCQNCMVLKAQADLADRDGKKMDIASGVYSHHIIITNRGQAMVMPPAMIMCPNGMPGGTNFMDVLSGGKPKNSSSTAGGHAGHGDMAGIPPSLTKRQGSLLDALIPKVSVFIGQGDEGTATSFYAKGSAVKTGFFIGTKDTFSMLAEVVNYEKKEQEVYVTIDYEYIPNVPARTKEWLEVGMGALTVTPCSSQMLRPPIDRAERYVSPPWTIMADGYLVDMKPHMHDGGVNTTVILNGKPACTLKAKYGGTDGGATINGQKWETITAYDVCSEPIKVSKGDKITMEAWYDLTAHKLRPMADDHNESAEGMALASYLFAKSI
ncbi:hypothetical protein FKW77_000157 [Venturia effusa]|uniref:Plastocyanin-like domain-containing protein n=1 Tax=Venturia effusa TaxID=50376 RepID=A0A517LA55_9PEZI|nr:hypothetical protein FKW77_000157 [Venturia effusa]